jgi:murein DD-endopeptidase / murein LD-carboxypeptidase
MRTSLFRWAALALVAAILGAGCAGSGRQDPGTSTGLPYRPESVGALTARVPSAPASTFERTNASGQKYLVTGTDWRVAASSWIGTPYRTGGTTRQGADCSGFAQSLYREVTGLAIPRTTSGLWQEGKPVDVSSLRPGDLVFFSNVGAGDGVTHVGVVIGEGEFAHASTSQGVRFASHDRGYWQKRFAGGRRFLP